MVNLILFFLLNIRNEENLYTITNEFYLKNKFKYGDPVQYEEKNMYLVKTDIVLDSDDKTYSYYLESYFPQKSTGYGYILVDNSNFKSTISNIKSRNDFKFLWKVCCWFSFKPIDKPYEYRDYYKEQELLQEFITYKFLNEEQTNKNSIELSCTKNVNCMEHVKDMFAELICMNPLKLYQYIKYLKKKKTNSKKIEDNANFHLCHYKDYSLCLKKLKVFIKSLRCFKLVKNELKKNFINETTTLKVSKFRELLEKKFYEDKQTSYFYNNNNGIIWKTLFKKCFNYLKKEIQNNNIFLLIGDEYDIEFYITNLSKFIFDAVSFNQKKYAQANSNGDKAKIFTEIIVLLENDLKSLQNWVVRDRHDFSYDYNLKHFSKWIKKKVGPSNNYIEVEKKICDYCNMFLFIFNSYYTFEGVAKYSYVSLVYNDEFNLSVISGIQIKFKNPVKFKQITGFKDEQEGCIMEQDTDFFIDKFNRLHFTSDVLELNKIKEIEVIFEEEDTNIIRFKISENIQVW